jgi:hypothetical protein
MQPCGQGLPCVKWEVCSIIKTIHDKNKNKKKIVHIRFELSRFRHGAFLISIENIKD